MLIEHLDVVAGLVIDRRRIREAPIIRAARKRDRAERARHFVVDIAHPTHARDQARRQAHPVLENDVDRAADALAVDVGARRTDDLDPIDDFRRNAVHEHGAVVARARNRTAVDEHLGEALAQAAQLRRIALADVARERHARHAR